MTDHDFQMLLKEAKENLPFKQLIEQFGQGPQDGKWKSYVCPFCDKKTKGGRSRKTAGIFTTPTGDELWQCKSTSCPTRATANAFNPVTYLAYVTGVSNKQAFKDYLKMAGVKDRTPTSLPSHSEIKTEASIEPTRSKKTKPGSAASEYLDEDETTGESGGNQDKIVNFPHSPQADESGSASPADGTDPATSSSGQQASPVSPAQSGEASSSESPSDPDDDDDQGLTYEQRIEQKAREALRMFYDQLVLTEEDRKGLLEKRGLTGWTCQALGYKSSLQSNRKILQELKTKHGFKPGILAQAGLWTFNQGQAKPNVQFYGFGIKGKKPHHLRENESDKLVWDWTYPILIPYFDKSGGIIHLRPHKGNPRRSRVVRPRPYIPRLAPDAPEFDAPPQKFKFVFITESEFKVAAIWQICGIGGRQFEPEWKPFGVAGLPGIQQVQNDEVTAELFLWLKTSGAQQVAVIFDNEDKGNPEFPGFNPNKEKRFDCDVYAQILCIRLENKFGWMKAHVGRLPKAWQDENGKADWDGALSRLRRGELSPQMQQAV